MKEQVLLLESLLERTEDFARSNAELYKLKAIDKISDAAAAFSTGLILIVFSVFFFIPMNIGLAFFIGEALNRISYGFFVMSGFYALCLIVTFLLRRKLIVSVKNSIVSKLLE